MGNVPKINDPLKDCSLLLLRPKRLFFDWLEIVLRKRSPPILVKEVYFPEEDTVWLVPKIGRFGSEAEFMDFILSIKKSLLKFELSRFAGEAADVPDELSATMFDEMFSYDIRDALYDIRALKI